MYFLSTEETKMLQKDLIPRVRESGVAEELRGWNWHEAPLRPPYDVHLALYEIAGKYCPNGRDVFLRRVAGEKPSPGRAAIAGTAYHTAVVEMIQEAKRLIYALGPGAVEDVANGLQAFEPASALDIGIAEGQELEEDRLSPKPGQAIPDAKNPLNDEIRHGIRKIKCFEVSRIVARLEEAVSKQPYISADSLVATALPVTCEHRLNGSFLGLSSLLSCDAALLGGTVVFDLKFGRKRDFHRLSTTGYALVMESLWDFPVDIGCAVYVDMRRDVPAITRDLYAISDELRQWFLDERDEKMRIVAEELDPGVAEKCYEYCEFRTMCIPR